jgi:hypothetical protein
MRIAVVLGVIGVLLAIGLGVHARRRTVDG